MIRGSVRSSSPARGMDFGHGRSTGNLNDETDLFYETAMMQPTALKNALLPVAFRLTLCLALFGQAHLVFGQNTDITWTGGGDGTSFSDDSNWSTTLGVFGPEFAFADDSLKFSTTGATINNDLDPASNDDVELQLGPGTGAEATSAAFHFLAGSGDFTFNGFPVKVGSSGQDGVFRADAGAGALQTFNVPITFTGGQKRRKVVLENNGTVIFNGNINYTNSIMFIDEGAGRVEINGDNTGVGPNFLSSGTNAARTVIRNNVVNTVLSLGSDTALGDATTGTWDTADLQLRGLTANQILNIEASAARDFSGYHFTMANSSGGGSLRFDNTADVSIGYLMRAGNGTRVTSVMNTGVLTIEKGIFASTNDQAREMAIFAAGTDGNVPGANGQIVINGRLHTALMDSVTAAANGHAATAGIVPGLPTDAVPGNQILGVDGVTPVNGSIQARYGTFTLNGDSSSTWIGSQFIVNNGSTVNIGHDNALGDANSIVAVNGGATLDIGAHTLAQRFHLSGGGTVRGNGTLTNEGNWSVNATVQPGGATPVATDTLTFDFSNASVANTVQFESPATADFVLDAGNVSSTIVIAGSLGGGTSVILNDNAFSFTDLTNGSLALGTYTLFDGDANTSFTLGSNVTLAGLDAYPGSTLSISGDDLVLTLNQMAGLTCDLDADADCDQTDIDLLYLTGPDAAAIDGWLAAASSPTNPYKTTYPGGSLSDVYVVGDANLNGDVDSADLGILLNNFGATSGVNWGGGDLNADGGVDSSDLGLLLNRFGSTSAAFSAVPEPSSCLLVLMSLLGAIGMGRRRR